MASEIRVNQIQSRTGVSTISFTETGPIISGVTTITGDLDVTGLVSYDDVTNIDSVGVVTARDGLHVTGGNIAYGNQSTSTANNSSALFHISAGKEYWSGTAGDYRALKHRIYDNTIDDVYGMGISSSLLEIQAQVDIGFFAGAVGSGTGRRYERLRIKSNGEVRQQSTGGSTIYELKRADSNTTGSVGTINFTASDGHSVASMSAMGDGDNEGAHIVFRTTSAAVRPACPQPLTNTIPFFVSKNKDWSSGIVSSTNFPFKSIIFPNSLQFFSSYFLGIWPVVHKPFIICEGLI